MKIRPYRDDDYYFTHDLHKENMLFYIEKYWGGWNSESLKKGFDCLFLQAFLENRARHLYERLGFKTYDITNSHYLMKKELMENVMPNLSFEKIEQSIKDRKKLHLQFLNNVKTYKPFLELEERAFENGALGKKTKELMALSISIVTKCEPCMEWHLDQALQAGATEEEVYETIDVAIEMGGGPAGAYARFVLNALEYFNGKKK